MIVHTLYIMVCTQVKSKCDGFCSIDKVLIFLNIHTLSSHCFCSIQNNVPALNLHKSHYSLVYHTCSLSPVGFLSHLK